MVPVFTFKAQLKFEPALGSTLTVPCVWNVPEFETVLPLLIVHVPELNVKVLALRFNIPPLIAKFCVGEKVILLVNETFPEPLIFIFWLENVPELEIEVVESKFKLVGLITPLFTNEEPRIIYVELPPEVIVPLFVTVPFACDVYPPPRTVSVAPASTMILP